MTMLTGYNGEVESLRQREYSHMRGVYLDHGGATIYAKSTVEAFSSKMITGLYGNPHSENSPAKLSGEVVDIVRAKMLDFFGANTEDFDLIFVANATSAIKLVADAFRDLADKSPQRREFWYGYHKDAHTSLVGVREFTGQSYCFNSDEEVEEWLEYPESSDTNRYNHRGLGLFAYPGQSNLTGRRLPLSWSSRLRRSKFLRNTYTLLDAAALAMTFPMENIFQDRDAAPDFTCFSLYKIFGFPDLGTLVVRKDSGHILSLRKYFGGGTVSMVSTFGDNPWHQSKGLQSPTYKLHEGLEDGTLPFHSILALGEAIDVHRRLYGSMKKISEHTAYLTERLHYGMTELRHANGRPACHIYSESPDFGDSSRQGPTIAFNMVLPTGDYISYSDVERIANNNDIYVRSGGVCNPGGIFSILGYEPWYVGSQDDAPKTVLSIGKRIERDLLGITVDLTASRSSMDFQQVLKYLTSVCTGSVVRASIGAMSTRQEVDTFIKFLQNAFIDHAIKDKNSSILASPTTTLRSMASDITLDTRDKSMLPATMMTEEIKNDRTREKQNSIVSHLRRPARFGRKVSLFSLRGNSTGRPAAVR
ncbi:pyridoxal phosphate-dependent transferase [Xylariaceae sp. FL0255]|nr:pyridoxal phosphate-dependent transferase [Xylariaceae sp. FL0255]